MIRLKEDWGAISLGLGLVLAGVVLFERGSSLQWLAVTPARWSSLDGLMADLIADAPRYAGQFFFWLAAVTAVASVLGCRWTHVVPAFALLYGLGLVVFAAGQWTGAVRYSLEPPLLALLVGLAVSNFARLPRCLDAGFHVDFYVKTGIVLLGATLPLNCLVWAGPVALLQASVVSIVTFLVIFWTARWFALDRRLAAVLGVGGAVGGVSAAIAITWAVGARRQDASLVIAIVTLWAVVMTVALPVMAQALHLPAGVAGAWIGTSAFTDVTRLAAAETYGGLVEQSGVAGAADQTVWAFTMVKVLGRDVWTGTWAVVLALLATTRWNRQDSGGKVDAASIWRRFPIVVIGFLVASVVVTIVSRNYSMPKFDRIVKPGLVGPLNDLRDWAFIFCFLSIGLTTRVADLTRATAKPVLAFSAGVIVNVVLGFVLSAIVLRAYWETLSP